MSDMRMQETGDALGDDRDYFEEDFAPLLLGSVIELPEGYDVTLADLAGVVDPHFTASLEA